MTRKQRSLSQC